MPSKPTKLAAKPPAEMVTESEAAESASLRQDAQRYRWLRQRGVKIGSSDVWWQGDYLDLRCDTGLAHVHGEYEGSGEEGNPQLTRPDPETKSR